MSLLMVKVPAESCTTCPTGHPSNAAWIPDVASCAPFPYVDASTVAQTVERLGMPPTDISPGFQTVRRSAGKKLKLAFARG